MASGITNYIRAVFTVDGTGRVRAALGQIAGGYQQTARATGEYGRQTGYLNNQMRALGTTLRYSLAGGAIFGAYRMVQTLQDTQRQLALIGFLGQDAFKGVSDSALGADQRLRDFYSNAQTASREALVPVSEFNDGLINLFSTINVSNPNRAIAMMREIARGAQFAQVSTDELTKTIAGLTQSFALPHTPKIYNREVRGFVSLITHAPGGVAFGPQIAQQLPQIAAVGRLARMNQSEVLGLYLNVLRSGGSPSTTGRGLQYLLQSLAMPTGAQGKALAMAGITPTTTQAHGGRWALETLISHAKRMGVLNPKTTKAILGMSPDQLDILDQADPLEAYKSLGISGPGLAWARQALGRVHALRALAMLMQRGGQRNQDIEIIRRAQSDNAQATKEYADAWARFAKDQPLKAAAISMDNLRRDVMNSVAPLVSAGAIGLDKFGQWTHRHPTETTWGTRVGLGLLTAYGIGRFFRGGGLFGGMGRVGGVGAAAASMAEGGTNPPTGRPNDPIFVVVLSQISGPGGPTVIGGPMPGKVGKWGPVKSSAKYIWPVAAGAAAFAAGDIAAKNYILPYTKGVNDFIQNPIAGLFGSDSAQAAVKKAGGRPKPYQLSSPVNKVFGQANVHVTVDAFDKSGKPVTKRVHTTMDLIPFKGGVTPQNRGKNQTSRSN